MRDGIFEYLINYGFSREEIQRLKDLNEYMYAVSLNKVKENISFFEEKGLSKNKIIKLANNSVFTLTLSTKRKNAFDEIYINKFHLTNEEIKHLLESNNYIYTCSPIEFDKIIQYLNGKGYSIPDFKKNLLKEKLIYT